VIEPIVVTDTLERQVSIRFAHGPPDPAVMAQIGFRYGVQLAEPG
jgi:hypothetical protein